MQEEFLYIIVALVSHVVGLFAAHGYRIVVRSRCVSRQDVQDEEL